MNGPSAAVPHSDPPSNDVIVDDLPCFNCRYNLRSLHLDAHCPECGEPILQTLHHGWLQFSDSNWLRRLRRGIDLIIAMCGGIGLVTAGIFAYLIGIVEITETEPELSIVAGTFCTMVLAFCVVWLIVTIFLTTPDPGDHFRRAEYRRGKLAWWIVFLACFHLIAMLPYLASFLLNLMTDFGTGESPEDLSRVSILAILAFGSLGILGHGALNLSLFLLVIHMRRIARREPAGNLAKLMTFNLWAWVALVTCGAVTFLVVTATYLMMNPQFNIRTTLSASSQTTTTTGATVISSYEISGVEPMLQPTTIEAIEATPTSQPTTAPAPVTPMPPFSAYLLTLFVPMVLFQCTSVIWVGCLVAAVFWFRFILTHSINENRAHPLPPGG